MNWCAARTSWLAAFVSEHEAAALAHWAGDGAVCLLERDAVRRALLVERCIPGTPLAAHDPDDALGELTSLVARLAVPAGSPFGTLEEEASAWAATLERRWRDAGQPFERRILDAALEYLTALPGTQGAQLLVHQDLHAGNVLRAEREPSLAIDPKPLVGEREFAAAPIVRGAERSSATTRALSSDVSMRSATTSGSTGSGPVRGPSCRRWRGVSWTTASSASTSTWPAGSSRMADAR